jgi:hypothetical protein
MLLCAKRRAWLPDSLPVPIAPEAAHRLESSFIPAGSVEGDHIAPVRLGRQSDGVFRCLIVDTACQHADPSLEGLIDALQEF